MSTLVRHRQISGRNRFRACRLESKRHVTMPVRKLNDLFNLKCCLNETLHRVGACVHHRFFHTRGEGKDREIEAVEQQKTYELGDYTNLLDYLLFRTLVPELNWLRSRKRCGERWCKTVYLKKNEKMRNCRLHIFEENKCISFRPYTLSDRLDDDEGAMPWRMRTFRKTRFWKVL